MRTSFFTFAIALILLICFGLRCDAQTIDFNKQIRPILSNKCFACHGPDENAREADVRLDTFEGATDWAIDLDAPEESELIARIESDDEDLIMPPNGHGKPLTKEEIQSIKQWIDEGAKYDRHWSYVAPRSPTVPSVSHGRRINSIDNFILSKLNGTGLQQTNEADRVTIARRLALDLTGLPPTLDEVKRFVADSSANAYEKLVDEYLARPAFGERWASVWLDLARYADSAGYAEDKKREIWAYRDYVIRSYNQNKPFDQFTREQLAGDLLPNTNLESKIATAFHRNTLTNSEGGTSDEEFRSAAVVDRVNTTMAVWMGTTMACAQCHTHKYDPITQNEYFQFYDFFNQTEDNDRPNEAPTLPIYSSEAAGQRSKLQAELVSLKEKLATPLSEPAKQKWLDQIRQETEHKEVVGQFVRIDLPGKSRILSLAEVQVIGSRADQISSNLAPTGIAKQSSTGFSGPANLAIDGNTNGQFDKKSVTHTDSQDSPWWEVDLKEPLSIEQLSIWNRTDNQLHSRLNGYRVSILDSDREIVWSQEFEQAKANEEDIRIRTVPVRINNIVTQREPKSEEQQRTLDEYLTQRALAERELEIATLESKLNEIKPITSVPVMKTLSGQKRVTQVQIRGNYLDTGDTVSAATPEAFHAIPADSPKNRLTLANWLVDTRNPLTARVIVNRYWEQLFGTGIVESSEEFGAQGELPSHPELLDWLASDLMNNNWDTRRLLKQIVMSATYRQSSAVDANALQIDPNNRLLARGPRVRLSAEMIRDQALAVSGLLSSKMFGPPVQPPQPKIGLKPAFTGKTTDWTDSVGEDRYRRGIYTEWRRSAPYPSMATFDVNSREVCEIRRSATNTPLQALVTLNDPVFVEAAQALARRIALHSNRSNPNSIAEYGFRLCLIRKPTQPELDRIVALFKKTRDHFAEHPEDAAMLATDPLNPPPPGTDLVELAAWTTVANVLLNLDEMLLKP